MGLFRRRHAEDMTGRENGVVIEEVGNSDRTPRSSAQPTVEEPDEDGVISPQRPSRRPEAAGSHHQQNPFHPFFDQSMPGFGGFGGHDPFGLSAMPGRDPFAAHREQFFNMGPSLFHRDPFFNSMGSLMGRDPFSRGMPFEQPHSSWRNPGEPARGRGGDHFAYEFQSWSSSGNGSGRTEERHFSARGSSDDCQHHVTAAVRDRDGNVTSRQGSIPFGRQGSVERPALIEQ